MSPSPAKTPAEWRQAVLQYIEAHPDRPQKARGLARALEVEAGEYPAFRAVIREMLTENAITYGRARTLRLPTAKDSKRSSSSGSDTFTGVFRLNRRGFGFIEVPDKEDVFVPRTRTMDALDGDVVEARLVRGRRRNEDPRAEVLRVVSHAETNWVGPLEKRREGWVVEPIGRAPAPLVLIADPTAKSARPGDLVVVEPVEQRLNPRLVRGVIVERLGAPNQAETKVRAVAARYGLAERFEPELLGAAREALENFNPNELGPHRQDLREMLAITIDPVDARDFDDAISIEATRDGWELGVHIADVAHFVPPGSPLDLEARRRGNSTYFPGYVVPMLPEVLSNGVCSLQPKQPRFAKTAFITYDRNGKVKDARFANSLIQSRVRLTYEQASAILAGEPADQPEEIVTLLKQAERLAKTIQKRRIKAGMVTLNLPEMEILRDENGEVCGAAPADTSFSHTLIEMFMVEANEAVCRLFARLDLPHIRRIHDVPNEDAIDRLRLQLRPLGIQFPPEMDHAAMQDLLRRVAGTPAETAVNFSLLRCLAQAAYAPSPMGHFALASKHYTHFTSPIRRYPDLIVHRLLDLLIQHEALDTGTGDFEPLEEDALKLIGRETSARERLSQSAERDARQWLLLDFMQRFLGETFEGLITGVSSFGAFVQIEPYLAEGLIHVDDFGHDQWDYHADSSIFVGRHGRRMVAFGQRVKVCIVSVDPFAQEMQLIPAEGEYFGQPMKKTPDLGRKQKGRRGGGGPSKGRGRRRGRR